MTIGSLSQVQRIAEPNMVNAFLQRTNQTAQKITSVVVPSLVGFTALVTGAGLVPALLLTACAQHFVNVSFRSNESWTSTIVKVLAIAIPVIIANAMMGAGVGIVMSLAATVLLSALFDYSIRNFNQVAHFYTRNLFNNSHNHGRSGSSCCGCLPLFPNTQPVNPAGSVLYRGGHFHQPQNPQPVGQVAYGPGNQPVNFNNNVVPRGGHFQPQPPQQNGLPPVDATGRVIPGGGRV